MTSKKWLITGLCAAAIASIGFGTYAAKDEKSGASKGDPIKAGKVPTAKPPDPPRHKRSSAGSRKSNPPAEPSPPLPRGDTPGGSGGGGGSSKGGRKG